MEITCLKIENRVNPIGIDEKNPRFLWKIQSTKNNVLQKAYQIVVTLGNEVVWDSGKVVSDTSAHIRYKGEALKSISTYTLKVTVWDNEEDVATKTATFETGILYEDNFEGKWITHTFEDDVTDVPVFKRTFNVTKEVKKARLYATSLGVYEAEINNKKVGEAFLSPGWTTYNKRLQYQSYDITSMLKNENEISISVGNGWYRGYLGFTNTPNIYGDRVAVKAMIYVEYIDGTVELCVTNKDWDVTTSYITYSELYYGEKHNYTLPTRKNSDVKVFEDTSTIGKIVSQQSEFVNITKRFKPVEKIVTPKGELVFNFGQNIAGFVEIKLPKLKGDKLVIRHAETLDKEGNFYPETLRFAVSIDEYIYSENEIGKVVTPKFTFHGFQYIAVEGVDEDVDLDVFTACALHTDMEQTGEFNCDNKLVQQLQSNIQWSQRGNFLDIPTDCPQRDERLGWTGDAQIFSNTAGFNFNTQLFFEKWLKDLSAEQTLELGVPSVVPNILGNQTGAAAWGDAATIIPWSLYMIYGDISILENQYESMKMWVEYIIKHTSENGLWQQGHQYGDWLGLDGEKNNITDSRCGGTDKFLVANAFYAKSTEILRDTAKVLGKIDDFEKYSTIYTNLVENINKEYVTQTGRLVSETQTACVLLLHFNLIKEEFREKILDLLEINLGEHRNHILTGFTGTPYIAHCLSENGKHDIAENMFLKEDCPGWLYAVKKGATTIWERWDSILPNGDFDESGMNSLNHYANGSIGDWLYKKVAGINPAEPGYKKILIKPLLTKGFTQVSATFESVYGVIKSSWGCKDGKITVDVTIPVNTTATILLPEKDDEITVGSGTYHYEYETLTNLEVEKFSLNSTLGEVLAEELAVSLFNQMEPDMLDNPMIQYAYSMTLIELIGIAPESKPLYEAVINALNKQ